MGELEMRCCGRGSVDYYLSAPRSIRWRARVSRSFIMVVLEREPGTLNMLCNKKVLILLV